MGFIAFSNFCIKALTVLVTFPPENEENWGHKLKHKSTYGGWVKVSSLYLHYDSNNNNNQQNPRIIQLIVCHVLAKIFRSKIALASQTYSEESFPRTCYKWKDKLESTGVFTNSRWFFFLVWWRILKFKIVGNFNKMIDDVLLFQVGVIVHFLCSFIGRRRSKWKVLHVFWHLVWNPALLKLQKYVPQPGYWKKKSIMIQN